MVLSIVASIEAKKIGDNWVVFTTNGRDMTNKVIDWAKKCEELGAGELLTTSIDKEGTWIGTDSNLNLKIVKEDQYQ